MKQLLSVWLVLEDKDKKYLQDIIQNLAKENNSPSFTPHLTLVPGIEMELEDLIKIINEVFSKTKPFNIKKINVSQSELFFKTVFIEFEINDSLKNIFNIFSSKTDKRSIEEFKPHISLIYKKMPKEEKLEIIKNLSIKDDFVIDKVVINAPKEGDTDYLNIEGWHSVYTLKLNN